MKILITLLLAIISISQAYPCAFHQEKPINTRQAARRIGEEVNVTGKVTSALRCKKSPGKPWKLILDENKSPFVVMIPSEFTKKWKQNPIERFHGKTIIARGTVTQYQGRPELTVARHFWILTREEMRALKAKGHKPHPASQKDQK